MIKDTLAKIESRISQGQLQTEQKSELLELISKLRLEVESLSQINQDQAHSITAFTDASTHEAIRQEKNPDLLKAAIQGLSSSVDGFEKTHPRLVEACLLYTSPSPRDRG